MKKIHGDKDKIRYFGLFMIAIAILITILMFHMCYTAYNLKIRSVTVELKDIPASFDNITIAIVSDLHIGLYVSERHIKKIANMIMKHSPTIIALAGDYIYTAPHRTRYYNPKNAIKLQNAISSLKAKLGVYSVMGNHDNWENKLDISNALFNSGVTVLDNKIVFITNNTEHISIGGVGDYYTDLVDLDAATKGVSRQGFHILLMHQPISTMKQASENGYLPLIDFAIAGHTHAGQIIFSPLKAIETKNKMQDYPKDMRYGLMNYGESKVYVSSGVGVVFLPLRLFAKPEIAIITLKRTPNDYQTK